MSTARNRVSLCILCYGDYQHLASRCLESISKTLDASVGSIFDIRIGLNEVSSATNNYVRCWSGLVYDRHKIRTILYTPERNVRKYPLMRRMFYDRNFPLQDWVMWFDDDSYLTCKNPKYFDYIEKWINTTGQNHLMLGETWERKLQGNQLQCYKAQTWWRNSSYAGKKGPLWVPFVTGGFWLLREKVIYQLDWPFKGIVHHGGDQALGVALKQRGARIHPSSTSDVRVNADADGRPSKAKRRGPDKELLWGANYKPGIPDDLSHHDFACSVEIIGSPVLKSFLKLSGL